MSLNAYSLLETGMLNSNREIDIHLFELLHPRASTRGCFFYTYSIPKMRNEVSVGGTQVLDTQRVIDCLFLKYKE